MFEAGFRILVFFCICWSVQIVKMLNIEIVKFDVENEEPVRDENGFCIPCEDGEVGEAIGEIQIDAAGLMVMSINKQHKRKS